MLLLLSSGEGGVVVLWWPSYLLSVCVVCWLPAWESDARPCLLMMVMVVVVLSVSISGRQGCLVVVDVYLTDF